MKPMLITSEWAPAMPMQCTPHKTVAFMGGKRNFTQKLPVLAVLGTKMTSNASNDIEFNECKCRML